MLLGMGMLPPLLPAQQNQNGTQSQILKLKPSKNGFWNSKNNFRAVENVEKMDLQAKLAEANTKLANAEFGKFERN